MQKKYKPTVLSYNPNENNLLTPNVYIDINICK